ncbi:MAG: hypothetical protein ACRD2L_08690 [Terriglobia bacterium]
MKGNDKLLTVLNELLADELTAISQYVMHSEVRTGATTNSTMPSRSKPAKRCITPSGSIQRILFLDGRLKA